MCDFFLCVFPLCGFSIKHVHDFGKFQILVLKKVKSVRLGHGCSGAVLLGWRSWCGAFWYSYLMRLRELV